MSHVLCPFINEIGVLNAALFIDAVLFIDVNLCPASSLVIVVFNGSMLLVGLTYISKLIMGLSWPVTPGTL